MQRHLVDWSWRERGFVGVVKRLGRRRERQRRQRATLDRCQREGDIVRRP